MAHDVFISYSSKDKAKADAVCATLESRGIRCWIAPRDISPGCLYADCIIDAINACRLMVLVFSAHANDSHHIRKEVERAVNRGAAILPFRIENVMPGKTLEYYISDQHWLDAMTEPMADHLEKLAESVKLFLTAKGVRSSATESTPGAASSAAASVAIPFSSLAGKPAGKSLSTGKSPKPAKPPSKHRTLWIGLTVAALPFLIIIPLALKQNHEADANSGKGTMVVPHDLGGNDVASNATVANAGKAGKIDVPATLVSSALVSSAVPSSVETNAALPNNVPARTPTDASGGNNVNDANNVSAPLDHHTDDLLAARAPRGAFPIKLSTGEEKSDYADGDTISFVVETERDCYITLLSKDSEGNVTLLLPNAYQPSSQVAKGRPVTIPSADSGFKMRVSPPHGQTQVKAIATVRPVTLEGVTDELIREQKFASFPPGSKAIRVVADPGVLATADLVITSHR